ncbi:hypothetical protein [Tistlia consotensis]|nr:hypothetical protein [Tistlia consotensis]
MTSDLDTYRAAWLLVRQHGDEAGLVAAQRADTLLAVGDLGGCRIWKRILAAVVELGRQEPGNGDRLQ